MSNDEKRKLIRNHFNTKCLIERQNQIEKFGYQSLAPHDFGIILGEEFGEVMREICEHRFFNKPLENYRTELIQLATVCMQMYEELEIKST